jgi:indole-3-glycerol phosphate synthase
MSTPTRLEPILADVRSKLAERKKERGIEELEASGSAVGGGRKGFRDALRRPGLSIIAEHKRKAPSSGHLAQRSLEETVQIYKTHGASVMSILTEEDHFGGHLRDLEQASRSGLPCIRKDFIVDPYMIAEAKSCGASAVLLLASVLSDNEIADYCAYAHKLDLAVLLEAHDGDELERALRSKADAIGVNARDLKTFEIDLEGAVKLLALIPDGVIKVAESGVHSSKDALLCLDAGADAALIGTALMRSGDPGALLTALSNPKEVV